MGTVDGDIGRNPVVAMLEGAGYAVIDRGFDVKAEAFVHAVAHRTRCPTTGPLWWACRAY
jgi:methanogenic corrinoid protein MtbC1